MTKDSTSLSTPTMLSLKFVAVGLLILSGQALTQDCSADLPCNQGCCSKEGYCGFGPDFCGDEVCVSACDAVAECGGLFPSCMRSSSLGELTYLLEYALEGSEACPLNVCCSEFG